MKELSIEEKAKVYDEAYKKVAVRFGSNVADEIFPKESEDEKILRSLKAVVKEYDMWTERGLSMNDVLSWLEKQGEKGAKGNEVEIPISKPPLTIKHAREVMGIKQDTAWSEDDVKMIGTLIAIFEVNYPDGFYKVNPIGTTNMQGIHSSEIIKWLKSIKERCTWKPSKEQIEILQYLCENSSHPNKKVMPTLKSLYQDLKKLMEE